MRRFRERRLDALLSVGGDGTLSIARDLHKKGLRVVGVPKTIDNDLEATMSSEWNLLLYRFSYTPTSKMSLIGERWLWSSRQQREIFQM